jgi:hypothetical protein
VIRSFADKGTQRVWHEEYVRSLDKSL